MLVAFDMTAICSSNAKQMRGYPTLSSNTLWAMKSLTPQYGLGGSGRSGKSELHGQLEAPRLTEYPPSTRA